MSIGEWREVSEWELMDLADWEKRNPKEFGDAAELRIETDEDGEKRYFIRTKEP